MRCLREVNVDNNTVGWYDFHYSMSIFILFPRSSSIWVTGCSWNLCWHRLYEQESAIIRMLCFHKQMLWAVGFYSQASKWIFLGTWRIWCGAWYCILLIFPSFFAGWMSAQVSINLHGLLPDSGAYWDFLELSGEVWCSGANTSSEFSGFCISFCGHSCDFCRVYESVWYKHWKLVPQRVQIIAWKSGSILGLWQ